MPRDRMSLAHSKRTATIRLSQRAFGMMPFIAIPG
jgi:hypothetical protein